VSPGVPRDGWSGWLADENVLVLAKSDAPPVPACVASGQSHARLPCGEGEGRRRGYSQPARLALEIPSIPNLHPVITEETQLCLRQSTREDGQKLRLAAFVNLLIVLGSRPELLRCTSQARPCLTRFRE
jgi:hypothetical protein